MSPGAPSPRAARLLGTVLVAAAASGWGTWTLFLRGSGVSPWWQSIGILLVIALGGLPFALLGRGRPHARRRSPGSFLLLALLGIFDAGNYIFFFSAIDRGPIAVAVLAHYLAPVMVAALAPAFLREPIGKRTPPSLAASFAGLSLLVLGSNGAAGEATPAALLGGASALFYAADTLLSKRLLEDFASSEILSYHCLLSALLLLPLARGPLPALGPGLLRPFLGAVFIGGGCGALFLLGLRRIPAQRGAVLSYLEPLVASIVGALAFHEALGAVSLLGAAFILAGGVAIALEPAAPQAAGASE